MKQADYLYPLLEHHQEELSQCLMIRKGVQKQADVAVLKDFTATFWDNNLQYHIEAEEDRLLPGLEKLQFSAYYLHMIRRDHDLFMRTLMERIRVDGDDLTVYEAFASLVEYHIRFVEDVFLPKVAAALTEQQLHEISRSLLVMQRQESATYPVRFWE